MRIHLTARARALEPVLAAEARGINALAVDGLTRAESEQLMSTLAQLIANLGGTRA